MSLTVLELAKRLRKEQEVQLRWAKQHFEVIEDGHFMAIAINDKECALMPYPEFAAVIYRGQNKYHEPCLSSLYRGLPDEIDLFIERIRAAEFKLLLSEHPAVMDFSNQSLMGLRFRINYKGLAQHYRLKTELLDFTSNPFVAAFFACCEYCEELDEYHPITQSREPGIIYALNAAADIGVSQEEAYSSIVGLQPLRRPAEQYAWCYRLRNRNSLNSQRFVSPFRFAHDPQASKKIFEDFEGGAKLFPYDPVSEKAKEIASARRFSRAAFDLALSMHGKNMKEQPTLNDLARKGIQINSVREIGFTHSELTKAEDEWNERRHDFMSRIHCRLAYNPP